MKTKLTGYYSIILGLGVMVYWGLVLFTGDYPEGTIEISFHVFSEILMASICVVSGWMLIRGHWGGRFLNLVGFSMVLYSVLNAAGYFAQGGDWLAMILFLALFLITTLVIINHLMLFFIRKKPKKSDK